MFYFCIVKTNIGLWCNGNTTDSGPVILGSNPGSPTKSGLLFEDCFFFVSLRVVVGVGEAGSNCIIALANALRASMQV